MKNDEFAFLNQQLAAMVRDGIPLESALKRLCADMKHGALRSELEKLEADLAKGTPLREAVRARRLPELYRQMLEVGAQSNDLPGVLTMLADHYQRRHVIATRLKGLMVYPVIVLIATFLLSLFLSVLLNGFVQNTLETLNWISVPLQMIGIWLGPSILAILVVLVFVAFAAPPVRRALRWRLPAFREASLSQCASSMAMLLKSGASLDNALGLVENLEKGTPAEKEIAQWRQNLAAGHGKFSDMTATGKLFPPLFVWTVSHGGEDMAAGFQRAAETYQARASYRSEILLYSALPCAVLALGLVIISQIQPVFTLLINFMQMLGDTGS